MCIEGPYDWGEQFRTDFGFQSNDSYHIYYGAEYNHPEYHNAEEIMFHPDNIGDTLDLHQYPKGRQEVDPHYILYCKSGWEDGTYVWNQDQGTIEITSIGLDDNGVQGFTGAEGVVFDVAVSDTHLRLTDPDGNLVEFTKQ
jgi:catechol 2,3-dioxygenase-like lactoylglutathione lyase family enzyme